MSAVQPHDHPSLPSFDLDKRIAVITGASTGIGRTLALAFAMAGAHVVLVSRRADTLAAVEAEISTLGGAASVVVADVTSGPHLVELAQTVEAYAESAQLSIVLVNSAGFGFTKAALDTNDADWDQLFAIHVRGTFFCSRALAPLMIAQGYGKIINLSSTWSASTDAGKAAYATAKAAVSHLTASLSTEWAPLGVRVNALAPTTTMTASAAKALEDDPERAGKLLARIKLGRYATPEDIIGPAIFLASEASDFVTGHTLFVDGGWNAAG